MLGRDAGVKRLAGWGWRAAGLNVGTRTGSALHSVSIFADLEVILFGDLGR